MIAHCARGEEFTRGSSPKNGDESVPAHGTPLPLDPTDVTSSPISPFHLERAGLLPECRILGTTLDDESGDDVGRLHDLVTDWERTRSLDGA
jgi:hypothetical protein